MYGNEPWAQSTFWPPFAQFDLLLLGLPAFSHPRPFWLFQPPWPERESNSLMTYDSNDSSSVLTELINRWNMDDTAPLLYFHYRSFTATMGSSENPIRLLNFVYFNLYQQLLLNRTFPTLISDFFWDALTRYIRRSTWFYIRLYESDVSAFP